jgi:hypothetical protein
MQGDVLAGECTQIFRILGEGKLLVNPFCGLIKFQVPLCGTVTKTEEFIRKISL